MSDPPANPPPNGELPKRRRGASLRASRSGTQSPPPQPPQPPGRPAPADAPRRQDSAEPDLWTPHQARRRQEQEQDAASPARQPLPRRVAPPPSTGEMRRLAPPASGTVQERPVPAVPPSSGAWPGETGQFARPDWFTPPAQEPQGTPGSPPEAQPRADRAPRREPLRWRVLRRVVNTVLGLALVAAAVALQPFVLDADDRDAPITSSGGHGDTVRTAFFEARVEGVEVASALQQKDRPRVQAMSGQVFVIVKLAATASARALRLRTARLVTADGLRFHTTERLDAGASLGDKWVQPMWWSSGLYVFEVPPSALPGARLVVAEEAPLLFGDQYLPEASIDLGLDAAKATTARDVYEVPRT